MVDRDRTNRTIVLVIKLPFVFSSLLEAQLSCNILQKRTISLTF